MRCKYTLLPAGRSLALSCGRIRDIAEDYSKQSCTKLIAYLMREADGDKALSSGLTNLSLAYLSQQLPDSSVHHSVSHLDAHPWLERSVASFWGFARITHTEGHSIESEKPTMSLIARRAVSTLLPPRVGLYALHTIRLANHDILRLRQLP